MFSVFQSLILIIFTSSETSLDKLVVAKLLNKSPPPIYGTRNFMSVFIEVCHWAVFNMNQSNIVQFMIYRGKCEWTGSASYHMKGFCISGVRHYFGIIISLEFVCPAYLK